jgi:hypothetical protein
MILDVDSGNSVRLLREILTPGTAISRHGLVEEVRPCSHFKLFGASRFQTGRFACILREA